MSDKTAKILLVEDDTSLSAVYRARLEVEGFEVQEVNNGEDALAAALEFRPNLIVLDAMMPKIDGFDVLDILRNTSETANIRIIMLTALSQPKDKERAKDLGADDYLVKSQVVIGDVVERIKYHLNGGPHVQDESRPVVDSLAAGNDQETDADDMDENIDERDFKAEEEIGESSQVDSLDDAERDYGGQASEQDGDTASPNVDDADEELLEAALNELENTEIDEDSTSVVDDSSSKGVESDEPEY